MNKFVIVSIVTDVFLIMCQIFVNATGLWTLLGNNHDLMIMQSWFDENAMKQLTLLTLDYICISRSGTPSRYTEIHFVSNCLSKKRNRPPKRPPNAKSSNANEVPPHSFDCEIRFCNHKFITLHPDFEQNFVASLGNIFLEFFFNSLWIRTISEMIRSLESALCGAFVSVTVAIQVSA